MRTSTTDLLPRRPVAAAGTHASEDPWDVGPLPSRAEKARTSTDHAAAATAAGAGAYFRRHTSRSASLAAGHESRHVGGGDAHHLHPGTHRLQRMSMNGRAGHVSPHPPHADSDHRHGDFSQDAAWNPTVWHDAGSIDDAGTDDTWTNDPWTDGIVRRGATAAPRSSTSPTRYGDNDSERDIGGNDDGDSNGDHDRGRDASDTSATYAIDLPRPVSFGIRHDGAADLALAVERVTEGWDSTADDAAWKAIALDEQDVVESVEVHTFMQPRHRSDHHWRLRSRLAY
ncbi:hypothetical protein CAUPRSCDRAFT_12617 [Caulochytrium protostelioides]|nr:hypothetical protein CAUPRSCDRAFT_12617 [Caulochytrium protostelioides]